MDKHIKALRAAFPYTLPILAGFIFIGMAYGIYANVSGFSFLYPLFMSTFILAGSVEFVTVNMLLSPFNPLQALLLTLMVNARHLFYGISMLDKYKGTGLKKFYLIYAMCDESFSVNYSVEAPEGVDRGRFMFYVTLLNHFYWVLGSTLGGLFGSLLKFDLRGLDFVLTAMFVVFLTEQWMRDEEHIGEWAGLGLTLACLVIFGPNNFMIPSMICILAALTLLRGRRQVRQ